MTDSTEIHRGLKGVYFDRSRVCFIDGRAGELRYRGYSIHDLAERSTFEETCYLLLHGDLPSPDALARFDGELKAARMLPPALYDIIRVVKDAHPMDVLRTAISALAAFDAEAADNSAAATLRKGITRLEVAGYTAAAYVLAPDRLGRCRARADVDDRDRAPVVAVRPGHPAPVRRPGDHDQRAGRRCRARNRNRLSRFGHRHPRRRRAVERERDRR